MVGYVLHALVVVSIFYGAVLRGTSLLTSSLGYGRRICPGRHLAADATGGVIK
jgi:hypothetical protein